MENRGARAAAKQSSGDAAPAIKICRRVVVRLRMMFMRPRRDQCITAAGSVQKAYDEILRLGAHPRMLRFNKFFQTKSSRLMAAFCLLLPTLPVAAQTAVSYEH